MEVRDLFDVFSRRRGKTPSMPKNRLTSALRTRVIMLCRDRFSAAAAGDYSHELWRDIHRRFTYLLGRPRLSRHPSASEADDLVLFLATCSDEHFIDFIEYVFRVECYWQACPEGNVMVEEINHFLLLEDLPYAITPFVHETRTEQLWGHPREVSAVASYPKVVLREHQVLHDEAVTPAIHLLADIGFSSADKEFLEALEDYRKGRYGDCLTKCGSAFESTMKLICAKRKWPYKETDTASELLRGVLAHATLESYFEQPLLIIATLRNRLSSSHGAGGKPRSVSAHRARYAINATAAAILLFVEECASVPK